METEIRIKIPEGMEIDKDNSTFECIKFRPKKITYKDIQKELLHWYTCYICTTPKYESKCITFRKLLEVADYLNEDWKPDWNDTFQLKYVILYNKEKDRFEIESCCYRSGEPAYFSSEENAKKAIDIIGKKNLNNSFHDDILYFNN